MHNRFHNIYLKPPVILSGLILLLLPVACGNPNPTQHDAPRKIDAANRIGAPSPPVRMPGEFEPVKGVIIQWDFNECNALHAFLVEAVQEANATAYVLVDDEHNRRRIVDYLESGSVPTENTVFITCKTNSLWVRDYGPTTVYCGPGLRPAFIDWKYAFENQPGDDNAPQCVASALEWPVFSSVGNGNLLVLDGGDLFSDGFGSIFSSEQVINDNGGDVSALNPVKEYTGADRYVILESLGTERDRHLDMYMKLLDEETILVGQYPDYAPGSDILEANVNVLENLRSCYGRPYRIIRIPLPAADEDRRDLRSYTNSLIVNNHVLVPVYGIDLDQAALDVYRAAMPGYEIVTYDCSNVVKQKGALHCVTCQIHRDKAVRIGHPRFTSKLELYTPIEFSATVWSPEPVGDVTVHVKFQGESDYQAHRMITDKGRYVQYIMASVPGEVRYYITVRTEDGPAGYKPHNAWAGGYLTLQVDHGT